MSERNFDDDFRNIVFESLSEYIPRVMGEIDPSYDPVNNTPARPNSVELETDTVWERRLAIEDDENIRDFFSDPLSTSEEAIIAHLQRKHNMTEAEAMDYIWGIKSECAEEVGYDDEA